MKVLNCLLVILLLFNSDGLIAQDDSLEQFVILEYGFPESQEYLDIRSTVSKRWNILNKPVAGCLVTEQLEDSVRLFNKVTFEKLETKFGEDWEVRYNSEIESALETRSKTLAELMTDTFVRASQSYKETISHNSDHSRLTIQIASQEHFNSKNDFAVIQNLHDELNDVIYRGFPNLFEIQFGSISEQETYELECINCQLRTDYYSDTLPINQYIIRPNGISKESILKIHSSKNETTTFHFNVMFLPDPEIYLNGVRTGNSIDLLTLDSTMNLTLKYDDDISLRSAYVVRDWQMNASKEPSLLGSGFGNTISMEQTKLIKKCTPGTQLSFICTVHGPDGILRKKAAYFVVR